MYKNEAADDIQFQNGKSNNLSNQKFMTSKNYPVKILPLSAGYN